MDKTSQLLADLRQGETLTITKDYAGLSISISRTVTELGNRTTATTTAETRKVGLTRGVSHEALKHSRLDPVAETLEDVLRTARSY